MENQPLILNEDYLLLLKNAPEPIETLSAPSRGNAVEPILILLGLTLVIYAGIKMHQNNKALLHITDPEKQLP